VKTMNNIFYDFVKVTAAIPGLIFYRPKWVFENEKARERVKGAALVISNHNGYADPILLMTAIWYRRHNFVCAKEFFEKPVSRLFFKGFHCIPIDRDNFNVSSFKAIVKVLKEGKLVSMFPEGHLVDNEKGIESFKSGMTLIALQGEASIVPVYLKPRKNFFRRQILVVGERICPEEIYGKRPTMEQIEEISRLIMDREEALKEYANRC